MRTIQSAFRGVIFALVAFVGPADTAWSQSTGTLQGTVTEDGAPLPGAAVLVAGTPILWTDSSGFYSVVAPAGTTLDVRVFAPGDGAVIAYDTPVLPAGGTLVRNYNLARGIVRGVVTENGLPLQGALVYSWTFNVGNPIVATGADGAFVLSRQSAWLDVRIFTPDGIVIAYLPTLVRAGETIDLGTIELNRGTVAGIVTENGMPLQGAQVYSSMFNVSNRIIVTGPDGRFSLRPQSGDWLDLRVFAPDGVVIAYLPTFVRAGETIDLGNIVLARGSIQQTVVENGVPLQGARVLPYTFNIPNPIKSTDVDGRVTFTLQSGVGIDHIVLRPDGSQLCRAELPALTPGQTLNVVNCTVVVEPAPPLNWQIRAIDRLGNDLSGTVSIDGGPMLPLPQTVRTDGGVPHDLAVVAGGIPSQNRFTPTANMSHAVNLLSEEITVVRTPGASSVVYFIPGTKIVMPITIEVLPPSGSPGERVRLRFNFLNWSNQSAPVTDWWLRIFGWGLWQRGGPITIPFQVPALEPHQTVVVVVDTGLEAWGPRWNFELFDPPGNPIFWHFCRLTGWSLKPSSSYPVPVANPLPYPGAVSLSLHGTDSVDATLSTSTLTLDPGQSETVYVTLNAVGPANFTVCGRNAEDGMFCADIVVNGKQEMFDAFDEALRRIAAELPAIDLSGLNQARQDFEVSVQHVAEGNTPAALSTLMQVDQGVRNYLTLPAESESFLHVLNILSIVDSILAEQVFSQDELANMAPARLAPPEPQVADLRRQLGLAPEEVFGNDRHRRKALDNKLAVVSKMLADGNVSGAIQKIRHDLLPKVDDCFVASSGDNHDDRQKGRGDAKDWIIGCDNSASVYFPLLGTLRLLEAGYGAP